MLMTSPQKPKDRKHHAALLYSELPQFMAILSNTDGIGARALELSILTATRTKESLGARWSEIDLDKHVCTIPKERMKAGVEHRIPLSKQAMSNAGMPSVLKRLGRTDITVHGFRSTFRDDVAEKKHP